MLDGDALPQQTVYVSGETEQQAYKRTISMRAVTFTCAVCQQKITQLRYPGPLPRYCSPRCQNVQAQMLNEQRVRKQREKRQAQRAGGKRPAVVPGDTAVASAQTIAGSAFPLLAYKMAPPRLPALLVERAQLLNQLDRTLEYSLMLLQAPAGFGKTTIVNQWIADQQKRRNAAIVAWISLDAGDNDPLRFWRYLITACQTATKQEYPDHCSELLQHPFSQPLLEQILIQLLNTLGQQKRDSILILDDYHLVTEPRIHENLTFFLDHLPPTFHVLLLSRTELPLPLLRWRARGVLYELAVSDLRFTSEETATFLHQAATTVPAVSLSDATITQIVTLLEGWPAGLRLLSLSLFGKHNTHNAEQILLPVTQQSRSTATQRLLLDYFVSEILETQPQSIQHFLLQTSMLSRLNGPLCDAILDKNDSTAQLAMIEGAGLFLEALDGTGNWYRYHALFAEAMRREASTRLGEQVLCQLSQQASYWYEQQRMPTEAIETALTAQDLERVALLVEQIETEHFHELQTIVRWLKPIPDIILRQHPLLCVSFASALRFSQEIFPVPAPIKRHVEELLQYAEEGWRQQQNLAWIGVVWACRALSSLGQQTFAVTVSYAQQALVLFPAEVLGSHMQTWYSTCQLLVGIEKLRLGQLESAQGLLYRAQKYNTAFDSGYSYLTNSIHSNLGKSYLLQGKLRRARTYQQQVLSNARTHNDPEMVIDAWLELAWIAFEWNDLAGAEQHTREALELARQACPQQPELQERATLQLALLQHVQGESQAALQKLTILIAMPEPEWSPGYLWLHSRLRAWHGRLLIASGDQQLVRLRSDKPAAQSESRSITEYLQEQILQGRLLLAQNQAGTACQHFTQLLDTAKAADHQYDALEIQLLLALAYAADQELLQARHWLRQTLSQTIEENFIRLFLNEGPALILLLRSLLPTIQSNKALHTYAQMLLQAATQATQTTQTTEATLIPAVNTTGLLFEPLSAQEQRVLRLLTTGSSNKEIAQEMIVSVNTVKDHLKHLYRKLGVSNRLQASAAAHQFKVTL